MPKWRRKRLVRVNQTVSAADFISDPLIPTSLREHQLVTKELWTPIQKKDQRRIWPRQRFPLGADGIIVKLISLFSTLNDGDSEWPPCDVNHSLAVTAHTVMDDHVTVKIKIRWSVRTRARAPDINHINAKNDGMSHLKQAEDRELISRCVYVRVFIFTSSRWEGQLPWRAAWSGQPRTRQQWSPRGSVHWRPAPLERTKTHTDVNKAPTSVELGSQQ